LSERKGKEKTENVGQGTHRRCTKKKAIPSKPRGAESREQVVRPRARSTKKKSTGTNVKERILCKGREEKDFYGA